MIVWKARGQRQLSVVRGQLSTQFGSLALGARVFVAGVLQMQSGAGGIAVSELSISHRDQAQLIYTERNAERNGSLSDFQEHQRLGREAADLVLKTRHRLLHLAVVAVPRVPPQLPPRGLGWMPGLTQFSIDAVIGRALQIVLIQAARGAKTV